LPSIKYANDANNNEWPPYKLERFQYIMPQQQQTQQQQPVTYQTVQNPDGTYSQVAVAPPAKEKTESSSSTTPLLIGGALLALKLLI